MGLFPDENSGDAPAKPSCTGKGARNCVGNRVGTREIGGFVNFGARNLKLSNSIFGEKSGDCVSGTRHF